LNVPNSSVGFVKGVVVRPPVSIDDTETPSIPQKLVKSLTWTSYMIASTLLVNPCILVNLLICFVLARSTIAPLPSRNGSSSLITSKLGEVAAIDFA